MTIKGKRAKAIPIREPSTLNNIHTYKFDLSVPAPAVKLLKKISETNKEMKQKKQRKLCFYLFLDFRMLLGRYRSEVAILENQRSYSEKKKLVEEISLLSKELSVRLNNLPEDLMANTNTQIFEASEETLILTYLIEQLEAITNFINIGLELSIVELEQYKNINSKNSREHRDELGRETLEFITKQFPNAPKKELYKMTYDLLVAAEIKIPGEWEEKGPPKLRGGNTCP